MARDKTIEGDMPGYVGIVDLIRPSMSIHIAAMESYQLLR
jgi:hypothetical protein